MELETVFDPVSPFQKSAIPQDHTKQFKMSNPEHQRKESVFVRCMSTVVGVSAQKFMEGITVPFQVPLNGFRPIVIGIDPKIVNAPPISACIKIK